EAFPSERQTGSACAGVGKTITGSEQQQAQEVGITATGGEDDMILTPPGSFTTRKNAFAVQHRGAGNKNTNNLYDNVKVSSHQCSTSPLLDKTSPHSCIGDAMSPGFCDVSSIHEDSLIDLVEHLSPSTKGARPPQVLDSIDEIKQHHPPDGCDQDEFDLHDAGEDLCPQDYVLRTPSPISRA
ncbi:unnamed protein product, partial [Amoebophrya sp. A25]